MGMTSNIENLIYIRRYNNIYLDIPFSQKDYVKELGCKWDLMLKLWFITKGHTNVEMLLDRFNVIEYNESPPPEV